MPLGKRERSEDVAKKQAAEKAEKQRQAVAAAEEARLQAQKLLEEEERQKKQNLAQLCTEEGKIKDITAWVKSVPLSEPVGRIERSFSDGALLAELIHHFSPQLCDKRMYFRWNSSINKICNWDLLNYKTFPKMGIRLTPCQLRSILHPYSCGKFEKKCDPKYIYKLLGKVRDFLAENNRAVLDYRKPHFLPPPTPSKATVAKNKSKSRKRSESRRDHRDRKPTYSRVEFLLESGFYDRPDRKDCASEIMEMHRQEVMGCLLPCGTYPNFAPLENGCLSCCAKKPSCCKVRFDDKVTVCGEPKSVVGYCMNPPPGSALRRCDKTINLLE